jgi:hypothetical protein
MHPKQITGDFVSHTKHKFGAKQDKIHAGRVTDFSSTFCFINFKQK